MLPLSGCFRGRLRFREEAIGRTASQPKAATSAPLTCGRARPDPMQPGLGGSGQQLCQQQHGQLRQQHRQQHGLVRHTRGRYRQDRGAVQPQHGRRSCRSLDSEPSRQVAGWGHRPDGARLCLGSPVMQGTTLPVSAGLLAPSTVLQSEMSGVLPTVRRGTSLRPGRFEEVLRNSIAMPIGAHHI